MAIEKRTATLLILFEFPKAFDTIPHQTLLLNLRKRGCSDTVLSRFFSVVIFIIGSKQSLMSRVKYRSGSKLTRVCPRAVFSGHFYTNDLPSVLQYCKHMIYADDTQIYRHVCPNLKNTVLQAMKVFPQNQTQRRLFRICSSR